MPPSTAPDRPRTRPDRADKGPIESTAARLADAGLIAAFLALVVLLGVFPLKDTDFWWHLKAGDEVRRTWQVPTVDTLTYGAADHAWVDLHWGFQVLLSWGYEHVGVVGLNLAKCGITALAVGLLVTAKRREWPTWASVLAWLPAVLVLGGRMYIRPETLTLLYLAVDLAILARWERRPWLAIGLPVVQLAWVNSHGLFPIGPGIIAFALLDAASRPGAFEKERRGWWRMVLIASGLAGLACLVNPYGLKGALYPIQLLGTMGNPIFKNIGELKPLPTLIEEVGLDLLPLQIHLVVMALGALSFLIPLLWAASVGLRDRRAEGPASPRLDRPKKKARKTTATPTAPSWRLSPFRLLLYATFSVLSLAATRNSHQFAAVVGTVTAWNFAEWVAAVQGRRVRLEQRAAGVGRRGRLVAFAAVAMTILAVGSGRFYAWSGEGRTIGLGEERLWFPHEAVEFAGSPGMPDRLAAWHNGHPSLYEYRWGPAKKVYTDARLEVMGPELYTRYIDLGKKIEFNRGNWSEELEAQGRPAVMVDNLNDGNETMSATLLNSRHWRCVYFDPIVTLFVHDSNVKVIRDHGVDFLARHFRRDAEASTADPATLAATARALRTIGSQLRVRPGGELQGRAMLLLAMDFARKLRAEVPGSLDGRKQAGLAEYLRDPLPGDGPIPRFRLPFDPTFDLTLARATYDLARALEVAPHDGLSLFALAKLHEMRGMDEAALPLLDRFIAQPNKNLSQQRQKALAAEQAGFLRSKLDRPAVTRWSNLSDLDRVVATLLADGRAETAAGVIESAFSDRARPWEWADRLGILRLHLGQPARARAAWMAARGDQVPAATRSARVAATFLIEGDFQSARQSYREAIAADPKSFEAHYGLATLEQDSGHAPEALAEARLAEAAAPSENARAAARLIASISVAYAK